MNATISTPPDKTKPKLLDQVRELAIKTGHCAMSAEAFVDWNKLSPEEVQQALAHIEGARGGVSIDGAAAVWLWTAVD